MTSLEERFVAVVEALDAPDRDLSGPVLAAIDGLSPVRREKRQWAPPGRSRPWALAVMILAVGLAVVLVVTPARQAVAHWLGIGATRVVIEPGAGTISPEPSTVAPLGSPSPTGAGDVVDAVDVIPSLGAPSSVVDGPGRARTYRWPAGERLPALADGTTGALLTVRPADGEVVTKRVDPAVEIVFVEIPGRPEPTPALWIGGEHERNVPGGTPELAQRVLVWVDDGIEYRLEADLDLAAVLALAAEIEPGTRFLGPG